MKKRTLIMKTVLLETASEVVAAAMGELSTKMLFESEKADPDFQYIKSLRDKLFEIKNERNALDPNDESAIEALLKKYSKKQRNVAEAESAIGL